MAGLTYDQDNKHDTEWLKRSGQEDNLGMMDMMVSMRQWMESFAEMGTV